MLSWLQRIIGIHIPDHPSKDSPELQGSLPTPQSDHEDYQKLLYHYQELLEVLEDIYSSRGVHRHAYQVEPDLPRRWAAVYVKLTRKMAWCDRNMDAIEQRNAEFRDSELGSRRRDLTSRRQELRV